VAPGWQLRTKGQRYWPQGATWKAGVQAWRRAGVQACRQVQAGAGAPPKVPDVTLQPAQGGAHHRDNRPSPRPRWESLDVAATGPFEGGEVWLGHLLGGGGEAPRAISPRTKAWPLLSCLLLPPSCLMAPKIPPCRLLQSAVPSHVPEAQPGSSEAPDMVHLSLQTLHSPHSSLLWLFLSSGLDPQTTISARKMP
jgi:hypothetical protein